ncbi:MAG: hypothetical protein EPN88_17710 [Bacteroidetes bacterium]|nr:MAG: hypothetical protein EPN88_17710 [Bacteroidota bacterium]
MITELIQILITTLLLALLFIVIFFISKQINKVSIKTGNKLATKLFFKDSSYGEGIKEGQTVFEWSIPYPYSVYRTWNMTAKIYVPFFLIIFVFVFFIGLASKIPITVDLLFSFLFSFSMIVLLFISKYIAYLSKYFSFSSTYYEITTSGILKYRTRFAMGKMPGTFLPFSALGIYQINDNNKSIVMKSLNSIGKELIVLPENNYEQIVEYIKSRVVQ